MFFRCCRVKLEINIFFPQIFTCFGLKTHPRDHFIIRIAPKLHYAIDMQATLSCDNSGYLYLRTLVIYFTINMAVITFIPEITTLFVPLLFTNFVIWSPVLQVVYCDCVLSVIVYVHELSHFWHLLMFRANSDHTWCA